RARLHARSAFEPTETIPAFLETGRKREPLHRVVVSTARLCEVERIDLPDRQTRRREVRPARGGDYVVVGGVERAGYRLLARHAGRVHEAVRLRGRRTSPRASARADRRARGHRSQRYAYADGPAQLSRTLSPWKELRDGKNRFAARLRDVSRERRSASDA